MAEPTPPSPVTAEELGCAVRVLQLLGLESTETRQSPAYRELRRVMQPFVEDQKARAFRGTTGQAEYETNKARRRLKHAEHQRIKGKQPLLPSAGCCCLSPRCPCNVALDKHIVNSRQLRASRIESLRQLQETVGTDVPLIADGAASSSSSSSPLPSLHQQQLLKAALLEGADDNDDVVEGRPSSSPADAPATVFHALSCYICKARFTNVHFFYDRLCEECAELNYRKRLQTADLSGYICLVTGGRVKIGYHTVLKLLRAGATVIVTSRFPHDTALRYSREEDFAAWKSRVHIYGVDLRNLPSIEKFCAILSQRLPYLDVIINNACQYERKLAQGYTHVLLLSFNVRTVRRPTTYYQHLVDLEITKSASLPAGARSILSEYHNQEIAPDAVSSSSSVSSLMANMSSALLSQVPMTVEDSKVDHALFPVNIYDVNRQQVDLRKVNSWQLKLEEVQTPELVEVFSINAIAPFILNGHLKHLMVKSPHVFLLFVVVVVVFLDFNLYPSKKDRYIVNVSAMEGKFYRHKMPTHPHTNMAKAALNMMTRTSAGDYAKSNIFMVSLVRCVFFVFYARR